NRLANLMTRLQGAMANAGRRTFSKAESPLQVGPDVSLALGHGYARGVGRVHDGDPEPAAVGRVPAVGGLALHEDPADVGEAEHADPREERAVALVQEEPKLRVREERRVPRVALQGQAAHVVRTAEEGSLVERVRPEDLPSARPQRERRRERQVRGN